MFDLTPDQAIAAAEQALAAFPRPLSIPPPPLAGRDVPLKLPPHLPGPDGSEDAQRAYKRWQRLAQDHRLKNRSGLAALLFAARQLQDRAPEAAQGPLGQKLLRCLWHEWGLRVDVPKTAVGCRELAETYHTPQFPGKKA